MTGVQVTTSARTGPLAGVQAEESTLFIVGQAERGRVDRSVLVRSLAEFTKEFGDRVTYGALYDQVRTYFEEGGGRAQVARVVGPAATLGTLTLSDAAGSPVPTLRIDALAPGAFSTRLSVEVSAGSTADLFTLTVRLDGVVMETYTDLATPAAAATALSASSLVRGTDLGSATAAPDNNPDVLAATPLSAGTDDRASITATHQLNALTRFVPGQGTGVVTVPELPIASVAVGLAAHCAANNRVGLVASDAGASHATVKSDRATATAAILAAGGHPEYVAHIGGQITIPDTGGVIRTISPVGFAAAKRAEAIADAGVWRAPAGEVSKARFVLGVTEDLDAAAAQDYDAAGVVPIVLVAGVPWLYGWRSLSNDTANYRLLTARDVLNLLVVRCSDALQQYVFRPIDDGGRLLALVYSELVGILDPIAQAKGLYSVNGDGGYSVDVGPSVNPPEALATNTIAAVISARPAPTAETIQLTIIKAGPTAAV